MGFGVWGVAPRQVVGTPVPVFSAYTALHHGEGGSSARMPK